MEKFPVVDMECWGIPCTLVQQKKKKKRVEQWLSFPKSLRCIHVVKGQKKAMYCMITKLQ